MKNLVFKLNSIKKYGVLLLLLIIVVSAKGQVFDFVVAKDGTGNFTTVNEAINAVPENSERRTIFVKRGVYEEKVFIGNRWAEVNKKISLIGEHVDSVVITWSDYSGKSIPYPGKSSNITADGLTSPTFTVTSPDFYMENITICNPSTDAQAVALYQTADRNVIKNCKILGNQDTYRTKKGRRFFVYKSTIEGGVDFIYAGGSIYFYQCIINSNRNGYITAPEDIVYQSTLSTGKILRNGFFFNDCDLTANATVSAGSVYLGRPWGPECGSVFLNCRMGAHINSKGWKEWNGNENSACFAEYRSLNADGSELIDVSNRVAWSMQLSPADVAKYTQLSTIYNTVSKNSFDPISMVIAPEPVSEVGNNNQKLQWDAVSNVYGYIIYANGSAIGFSKTGSFTDSNTYNEEPLYDVRSVSDLGSISVRSGLKDDVSNTSISGVIDAPEMTSISALTKENQMLVIGDGILKFKYSTSLTIFDLSGNKVFTKQHSNECDISCLPDGVYVLQTIDQIQGVSIQKIIKR